MTDDVIRDLPADMTIDLCLSGSTSEGSLLPPVAGLDQKVVVWFREHRLKIFVFLVTAGLSAADAEEITQEAFLRLYRALGVGSEIDNILTWLFRVARNMMIDQARRRRPEALLSSSGWLAIEERLADKARSAEEDALHSERMRRLTQSLRGLSQTQLEFLRLRAEGLRYREIAEIYGVGTSTVYETVHAAIRLLGKECR